MGRGEDEGGDSVAFLLVSTEQACHARAFVGHFPRRVGAAAADHEKPDAGEVVRAVPVVVVRQKPLARESRGVLARIMPVRVLRVTTVEAAHVPPIRLPPVVGAPRLGVEERGPVIASNVCYLRRSRRTLRPAAVLACLGRRLAAIRIDPDERPAVVLRWERMHGLILMTPVELHARSVVSDVYAKDGADRVDGAPGLVEYDMYSLPMM